jgi:hypothetical protein
MSEDLVRKIADTLEIQNLKAVYCQAADMATHDPAKAGEILQTLFVPEVRADYGIAICEGREALLGYLLKMITEVNEWLLHGIQTPRIEVDGDTARGEWVIMVQIKQRALAAKEMLVGRSTSSSAPLKAGGSAPSSLRRKASFRRSTSPASRSPSRSFFGNRPSRAAEAPGC